MVQTHPQFPDPLSAVLGGPGPGRRLYLRTRSRGTASNTGRSLELDGRCLSTGGRPFLCEVSPVLSILLCWIASPMANTPGTRLRATGIYRIWPQRLAGRPKLSIIVRYWAWSHSGRRTGCTNSRSPAKRMRDGGQLVSNRTLNDRQDRTPDDGHIQEARPSSTQRTEFCFSQTEDGGEHN